MIDLHTLFFLLVGCKCSPNFHHCLGKTCMHIVNKITQTIMGMNQYIHVDINVDLSFNSI